MPPVPGIQHLYDGHYNSVVRRGLTIILIFCGVATVGTRPTCGGVLEFTDRDEWIAAVGRFTTIGFTEFPNNTFITDQYRELGVFFTDGDDNVTCCSEVTFPQDGAGLDGNDAIHLIFVTPQLYIAADFPGGLKIELFSEGGLIYSSSDFGGGGVGFFGGLLSPQPFDEVILHDPIAAQVALDDLHFGGLLTGDLDGDGDVDINDFLALIAAWGPCREPCPPSCSADLDADCDVGINDFLMLIANWGPSP